MSVVGDGSARVGLRIVGLTTALTIVTAACGGDSGDGGIITYRDPDRRALFEVPSSWHIYEPDELVGLPLPFVTQGAEFQLPVVSQVAFDGAGSRSAANLSESISTAAFPIGMATVREIGTDERDLISRYLLAELVVPYHNQPASQELLKQDFEFDNEFAGIQLAVAYTDSATEEDAAVYLISVTDPSVTKMYSIAVGCSLDCFNRNQDAILAVVDSYLVNTSE